MAGIDSWIDERFAMIADIAASVVFFSVPLPGVTNSAGDVMQLPLLIIWLAAAGIFFTFYLGFINVRYFGHALNVVRGKYDKDDKDSKKEGDIGRFQALMTSLSGTVGLGNIAGVAAAVSIGGPGAVLWMMLMGLFGMATKFVEVTLGVKYRHHPNPERKDVISGGPMYYLRDIFDNRNIPYIGHILAIMFAICCIGGAIGGGNMFQANQSYQQLVNVTGGDAGWMADKGWLYGLMLAFLVGLVIIGGIKSIARVASRLVPVMGMIYLIAGLFVILMHFTHIPGALWTIISMAISPEAGIGGFIGGLIVGVQRAVFSNEAGLGSAPIVHSNTKTDQPVSQGFVGMLGPFIDTVVICMVTALVIVITGAYQEGAAEFAAAGSIEGVSLTSRAFESVIPGASYVLALTVFLFAYSTMITWSFYGSKATTYLFGENVRIDLAFKIFFCSFVVVGASASLDNVLLFSDAMILSMAIPNIIGLYIAAPEVKRELKKYIEHIGRKEKQA